MEPTNIILIGGHDLVRYGLRALLEQFASARVVALARRWRDVDVAARRVPPGVLIVDLDTPGGDGFEETRHMATHLPATPVLAISHSVDATYVQDALRSGAAGYLSKSASCSELERAVRRLAKGDHYLDPRTASAVASIVRRQKHDEAETLARITPRQREILTLIAQGRSSKQIAGALGIKSNTVDVHRAHLMQRLNVHEVTALVKVAIKAGLASLADDSQGFST